MTKQKKKYIQFFTYRYVKYKYYTAGTDVFSMKNSENVISFKTFVESSTDLVSIV